jgi:hypothetical protein
MKLTLDMAPISNNVQVTAIYGQAQTFRCQMRQNEMKSAQIPNILGW